jgi:hypothetical protein
MGEKNPTYMYCVNVAKVEVDTNTGKAKVLRYTTVADVVLSATDSPLRGRLTED